MYVTTVHICNRIRSTHMRLHMCVFYVLIREGLPHSLKLPPFMLLSLSLYQNCSYWGQHWTSCCLSPMTYSQLSSKIDLSVTADTANHLIHSLKKKKKKLLPLAFPPLHFIRSFIPWLLSFLLILSLLPDLVMAQGSFLGFLLFSLSTHISLVI